jgi:small subunit ribosomal protein S4e
MLDKLGGTWAPRPSAGPHKLRECLPLIVLLRNRLKYALTRREVVQICAQRLVKVDGKVRTDINFPAGFMDVVSIDKTNENFRLLYDVKGRYVAHRLADKGEAKFKLAKVTRHQLGPKGIPYLVTHDGRTIRYPDPAIKVNDTVKINIASGKIDSIIKFDTGATVVVTGGHNLGRVGVLEGRDRHLGGFDIVHIKDAAGNKFATRLSNVFVVGRNGDSLVSLPKGKGIALSILQEREKKKQASA